MSSRLRTVRITLANLKPARGSQHSVCSLQFSDHLLTFFFCSKKELEEDKALATAELQDVARMARNHVQASA